MGRMCFPDEIPTDSKKKKRDGKDKNILEWIVSIGGGITGAILIGYYSFSFWESLLCLVLVGMIVGCLLYAYWLIRN